MKSLVDAIYHNPLAARLLHTTIHCLGQELSGCDSILDLGCGPNSPLRYVDARHKVGVDAFPPYIQMSKALGVHDEYIQADLVRCDFPDKSFDAVVMVEVLEHLEKSDGERLLSEFERIARKKIVITCPNGFLAQGSHDANPYQIHRSGWTIGEMTSRGYKVRGMAGLAALRKANDHSTSMLRTSDKDIYSSIRFRPRPFWFGVSAATQLVTHYLPRLSFELICIKDIGDEGPPRLKG